MSAKNQLLDPLGAICKLISLNFSGPNTKISIHNHILTIQRPYSYQSVMRMINGDGRENISEIFYVIVRIVKWYLSSTDNDKDENWCQIAKSEEIKRLTKYACSALRKLQKTYEYGNVVLSIQFYINILEDAINESYNDNKLPSYILEKELEFENLIDYEKLKNFWDIKKIERICKLYDQCFGVFGDDDLQETEKEAYIDGYLKSINSILELADSDFQKLIQNSMKG